MSVISFITFSFTVGFIFSYIALAARTVGGVLLKKRVENDETIAENDDCCRRADGKRRGRVSNAFGTELVVELILNLFKSDSNSNCCCLIVGQLRSTKLLFERNEPASDLKFRRASTPGRV